MKFGKMIFLIMLGASTYFSNAQTASTSLQVSYSKVNPTCNGSTNGQIVISITGGTAPYIVNNTVISGSTHTLTNLSEGSYTFNVVDQNNGNLNSQINLAAPPPPQISVVIGEVTTIGGNNGYIDLTVVSQHQLSYFWTTSAPINIAATEQDLMNIVGGEYNVLISESNGCSFSKSFTVIEKEQIYVPNVNFEVPENISNETTEISVFPNPSFGEVTIKTGDKIAEYSVVNEMGTTVAQGKGSFTNDTLNLKTGRYYIISTDVNGNTTRKHLQIL